MSQDYIQSRKNKLKMIVSAREQELKAWKDLEEKYSSPQLLTFLREFKSESIEAEKGLVDKIEKTTLQWKQKNGTRIVDGSKPLHGIGLRSLRHTLTSAYRVRA